MKVVSSQWAVVRKSVVCFVFCAMLFALCSYTEAQQMGKNSRIGLLDRGSAASAVNLDAFGAFCKEGLGNQMRLTWQFVF